MYTVASGSPRSAVDGGRACRRPPSATNTMREPLCVGGRDVAAGHVAEESRPATPSWPVLERGEDVQCVPAVDVLLRGVQQALLVDVRLAAYLLYSRLIAMPICDLVRSLAMLVAV